MCTIGAVDRKGIMSLDIFSAILDSFKPYADKMKFLTLHGMGEPLMDKGIVEKVNTAKKKGFNGVGFATNATFLTEELSTSLITSGLNTIIFSLDGLNKETHESIRRGVNYDEVVNNIKRFIHLRGELGETKIIMRMIRQESNADEWDEYYAYWTDLLSSKYGDQVSYFDLHNWGEKAADSENTQKRYHELKKCQSRPDLSVRIYCSA